MSLLPTQWPKNFVPDDCSRLVHAVVVQTQRTSGHSFGLHCHKTGQLTIAVEGMVGVRVGGKRVGLPPGSALWLPSAIAHEGILGDRAISWYVHFAPSVLQYLPKESKRFYVSPLALEAARVFLEDTPVFSLDSRFGRIASVLMDEIQEALPLRENFFAFSPHPLIRDMTEKLLSNPDIRQSRASWARMYGYSDRHFARILDKELGISFSQWRLQLMMYVAVGALQQGATTQEVAERLGYQSASSFIAAFVRMMGTTPSQYRKEKARGNERSPRA